MIDAFLQGTAAVFQPTVLTAMLAGTVIGLVVGIIPAVGSLEAMAILIPFVFRLPPEVGLGFLVALASVVFTSGSITTILVGIPGTATNVATLIDGFPMNQKGEGARAIGAALTASMFGGVVAVAMAMIMIPVVVPLVMAFRTPEMVVVILMGLMFIAVVTEGSRIKGIISGLLGIILAMVGTNALTGTLRFTYGTVFLREGIGLIPLVLGAWGVASLLDLTVTGQTSASSTLLKTKLSGVMQGAKDVLLHKWMALRSAVIGYIIGVIPGVGAPLATFMAYGQAKQISKNPEQFGHGCVEGVIAPETANNAKEAGALLTTMVFGIPGSADMAIMMGAFFLLGVIPGPQMVKEHLPLAFTLLIGIAFANIVGGVLCFLSVNPLMKVARISVRILFPLVSVVIIAAAFTQQMSIYSAVAVFTFGILGFLMKMFGYSRTALTLGFVLGGLFEHYLYQALKLHGPLFFLTPISLIMIAIMVFLLIQPYINSLKGALGRLHTRGG